MGLSQEAYDAGQELASATEATLPDILSRLLRRFMGSPYQVTSACVVDQDGNRTERFASVVYTPLDGVSAPEDGAISVDGAAVVVDAYESLDLETLRVAYGRIARLKSLKKSAGPGPDEAPRTTVTLGVIFALRSALPLDDLAEELDRLNAQTPGGEWPNMVAVASTGVVNYAFQFPGESSFGGDFLIPAEGEIAGSAPPMYIVLVMRPTGTRTFNKVLASVVAHLAIFSPGAKVPSFTQILEAVPHQVVTISGYQYNLSGDLLPVPRQFYSDRYLPPLPWRIEDQRGNLLSTLQFLPWQDGGVILLRGKLPLEGLLVFLAMASPERARVFRRPDSQITSVLKITQAHFSQMLTRIRERSNMVVQPEQANWVLQKIADEGSRSPFMARVFIGIMHLRDMVYPDADARASFDASYEFATSSLLSVRTTARDIVRLSEDHVRKVASGEIARLDGRMIRIDQSIDKELRRQVESFLNTAVRTLKQGMQSVAKELQLDIGFLFKRQAAFDQGLAALESTDPGLAAYVRQTRTWSERLLECRNAIEHKGWVLAGVEYSHKAGTIHAKEPCISGQPVSQFVRYILDRLTCFVEEVTVHCLQRQMPAGATIAEIPLAQRPAGSPERFRVTLTSGRLPAWHIAFHSSSFENT